MVVLPDAAGRGRARGQGEREGLCWECVCVRPCTLMRLVLVRGVPGPARRPHLAVALCSFRSVAMLVCSRCVCEAGANLGHGVGKELW